MPPPNLQQLVSPPSKAASPTLPPRQALADPSGLPSCSTSPRALPGLRGAEDIRTAHPPRWKGSSETLAALLPLWLSLAFNPRSQSLGQHLERAGSLPPGQSASFSRSTSVLGFGSTALAQRMGLCDPTAKSWKGGRFLSCP